MVSPETIEFVLGITAGEGSFHLTFARDRRRKFGVSYGIRFRMNMGKHSKPLLLALQDETGLGAVNEGPKGYSWTISSREECQEFATLINDHLRTHESLFSQTAKFKSYNKWLDALDILQPGRRLTREEVERLAHIKEHMNRIPDTGRTADEIVQIIENNTECGEEP